MTAITYLLGYPQTEAVAKGAWRRCGASPCTFCDSLVSGAAIFTMNLAGLLDAAILGDRYGDWQRETLGRMAAGLDA